MIDDNVLNGVTQLIDNQQAIENNTFLAAVTWDLYSKLIDKGFTNDNAMTIVMSIIGGFHG